MSKKLTMYTIQNIGEQLKIRAWIAQNDVTNKNVIWSSRDPEIASVTSYNNIATITARSAGATIVTATSEADMKSSKSFVIRIPRPIEIIPVTGIEIEFIGGVE